MLVLLSYELIVFLASVRIIDLILGRDGGAQRPLSERWLAFLLLSLVISALLATILTFSRRNHPWIYLSASAILLIVVHRGQPLGALWDLKRLWRSTTLPSNGRASVVFATVVVVVLPLLLLAIRPMSEPDSLLGFNALAQWFRNEGTPWDALAEGYPYPTFWGLTYLPSIVLSRSDRFLWLNSLKAVVVVFLALYSIARHLGLGRTLGLTAAFAGVALRHYWAGSSGVATIKDDTIVAAGYLSFVLANLTIVRSGLTNWTAVLFALSLPALTAKATGAIMAVVAVAFSGALSGRLLWPHRRRLALGAAAAIAVVMLTTGRDYAYWFVVYSNPFSPLWLIKVLGIQIFPGYVDTGGTAILDHVGDPRLWSYFMPPHGLVAGLFFPVVFYSGLLIPPVFLAAALVSRAWRGEPCDREQVFLAGLVALGWWITYIGAPLSAGGFQGDTSLFHMPWLNSLRYASGALLLTEVWLIYLLARFGVPLGVLTVIAGLSAASRIAVLYFFRHGVEHSYDAGYLALLIAGGGLSVGLICVLSRLVPRSGIRRGLAIGLSGMLMMLAVPAVFERNRETWLPHWKPAWERFLSSTPASIGVMNRLDSVFRVYPVIGARLQHRVRGVDDEDLRPERVAGLDHIVMLRDRPDLHRNLVMARAVQRMSFFPEATDEFVVVASRVRFSGNMPLREVVGTVTGAIYARVGLPLAGSLVGAEPLKREIVRDGDIVLLGDPLMLVQARGQRPVFLQAREGDMIRVQNLGSWDPDSDRLVGQVFVYRRDHWEPAVPCASPVNSNADFADGDSTSPIPGWQIFAPHGTVYAVGRFRDGGGPFVRVRAMSDAAWLLVGAHRPVSELDGVPVYIRGRIRTSSQASPGLDLFDFRPEVFRAHKATDAGTSAGQWSVLELRTVVAWPSGRDYFTMGLSGAKKGDFFDVSELSVRLGVFPFCAAGDEGPN